MPDTVRDDTALQCCWMPTHHNPPVLLSPYLECTQIIGKKTDDFVYGIVFPEPRRLSSKETGLDGFVVPSGRVQKAEKRECWESKNSEFFFAIHKLMVESMFFSMLTLDVAALAGIKKSGYFPGDMQLWKFGRAELDSMYDDENGALVKEHISFLP